MKKIVFILLIGLLTCNVSAQKKIAVKQRPTQEQKAKPSIYCQEGNEITGDTRAPELQLADSAGNCEGSSPNGYWRVTSESAWEKSEKGYLLDESGTRNPMYFSFQRLERLS